MEIHNLEQEEIRPLIFNYLFHFILFILVFIIHIIIYNKLFWIYTILGKIFIFGTYFEIIYFIFPIIPSILIICKYFKLKMINMFKKLSLLLLFVSIIVGLILSTVIMINTINSKLFYQECPFNLSLSHLNYIFSPYYGKDPGLYDMKDNCKSRRCILDSSDLNNEYPYIYLCNYNPSYEFNDDGDIYERNLPDGSTIRTKNQFNCSPIGLDYRSSFFKNIELYDYLDLCYYLSEFYYCERFDKPKKIYNLDLDDSCPETSYLFILYIICVLIIIIDIVITMLPWGVEFASLKRIIQIMSSSRRKPNSHNSTEKSSVASNHEETFKKENTVLIVCPINDENKIININKAKKNNNNINNSNENINNCENNNIKMNNIKKLCLKESSKEMLDDNQEEDKKIEFTNRPITIIQSSDRDRLRNNLLIDINSKKDNNNLINVFNKNNNKKELNVSTNFHNFQNNLNIRDIMEENDNVQ